MALSGRTTAELPLIDTTLLLVRHGQSRWNAARRIQGQTPGVELSELGHQQAALVAQQLLGSGATRVLSSDLTRARQTAAPIAAALGITVQLEPGLREQSMGALEGTDSADVWKSHPEVDWTDPDHRFDGAESRREVFDRMAATLTRVAGPQPTVLVSHGDAIRLALGWLAGRPAGAVPWHDIPNCSITQVRVRSGQLIDVTSFSANA